MSDTTICTDDPSVSVRIIENDKGNPPGKLADVELHFCTGLLHGLKLIGFALWERRGSGGPGSPRFNLNVTFPARQYTINGDRRSFALLRPVLDTAAQDRVRDAIVDAWKAHVEQAEAAAQQPVCTNCGQFQHRTSSGTLDCLNECNRRQLGFGIR